MKARTTFRCCGSIAKLFFEKIRRTKKDIETGNDTVGWTYYNKKKIVIDYNKHYTFPSLVDTILHEALHLASDMSKVNLTERQVRRIATAQRNALRAALVEIEKASKKKGK